MKAKAGEILKGKRMTVRKMNGRWHSGWQQLRRKVCMDVANTTDITNVSFAVRLYVLLCSVCQFLLLFLLIFFLLFLFLCLFAVVALIAVAPVGDTLILVFPFASSMLTLFSS